MRSAERKFQGLLSYFDSWTLTKGEDYYNRNKVLTRVFDEYGDLNGLVSGSESNVYTSRIAFSADRRIDHTTCSCPVRRDCKHTAALVLAYLENLPPIVPTADWRDERGRLVFWETDQGKRLPRKVRFIPPVPHLFFDMLKAVQPIVYEGLFIAFPKERVITLHLTTEFNAVNNRVVYEDGVAILEKHDDRGDELFVEQLVELGLTEIEPGSVGRKSGRFLTPTSLENWIKFCSVHCERLIESGWVIKWGVELQQPEPRNKRRQGRTVDFQLKVNSGEEDGFWFSPKLHIEFEGRVIPLFPILASAIRRVNGSDNITDEAIEGLNANGRFLALLPEGELIDLPFDKVRSILTTLQQFLHKKDQLELFGETSVPLLQLSEFPLSELGRNHFKINGTGKAREFLDKVIRINTRRQAKPGQTLNAELRPYQIEGVSWLQAIAEDELGGILADDMGLGKTVQMLAHICLEKERGRLKQPYLVICPTSVSPNWMAECKKFVPHLSVLELAGPGRKSLFPRIEQFDIVVTSYALLLRDIDVLSKIHWHGVALDEAQQIRTPGTKLGRAARRLKANHRICMTGTPVQNHLGDLWSLFDFLMPDFLGEAREFKKELKNPIEREGDKVARATLAGRVYPFLLRRTKREVEVELPEKVEIHRLIPLEGDQGELYETVRLAMTRRIRAEISENGIYPNPIVVLDVLLKLRQTCCDPRLVKLSAAQNVKNSWKLFVLVHMLNELSQEGRKVLVFSQFTSMLDLIKEELAKNSLRYVELTGDTKDRVTPVRLFQETDVPIFLISLKAGGTGLNLTAADTVIHYDPWWNPAVDDQATDRAHRIGQTKKVFVYKLIAKGTIEERMLLYQVLKRKIANCIFEGNADSPGTMSAEELDLLLSPIDQDMQ